MSQQPTRKLAAIMFTDMVGYTALMRENEKLAKQNRDRHRKVLNASILSHNGKILQYYGDGTLSVFDSSIEAILSAIRIQNELNADPKIPLRIGIHSGDVVIDHEGVYGDGVNIASRIESLAIPGSILISEKVFDDIKNHPELVCHSLGVFELKNVKKPLEIYAVSDENLTVPDKEEILSKTTRSYKSIAVLPFVNMSSDPENEYLSDGLSEEIINALAKINGMKVTSRTSAFAFKGQKVDIREISKKLGVSTILEGSVRKSENRVRVTAQLINSADGYHFWSETFDRNLEDIFELQDEIALELVSKLRKTLTGQQINDSLVKPQTKNIKAYNIYLKGLYHKNKYNPTDTKKAIELFEEAIKMQPDFPSPYASLAYCYGFLGVTGQINPDIAFQKCGETLEKALKLDPSNYESYLVQGMGNLYIDGDLDSAYNNFEKALKLNPGSAEVYHFYSQLLLSLGNYSEAIEKLEKALELDPLSLNYRNSYGFLKMIMKQYDEAIATFDEILDMDPYFRSALEGKGWCLYFKGKIELSIETFKAFQEQTGSKYKGLTGLAYVYAKTGRIEKADELLKLMHERETLEPETSIKIDFAIVYAGYEWYDKCLEILKDIARERAGFAIIFAHPMWDGAKKDPAIKAFMKEFAKESKKS